MFFGPLLFRALSLSLPPSLARNRRMSCGRAGGAGGLHFHGGWLGKVCTVHGCEYVQYSAERGRLGCVIPRPSSLWQGGKFTRPRFHLLAEHCMYACVLFLVFNCDCNEPCRRSGSRRVAGAGGESTEMFAVIGRASLRRLAIPLLHDPSNDFSKGGIHI